MNRKIVLTVISSFFACCFLFAQKNKFQQELSLGASFGTTFSRVSFAPTSVQQKMKLGYTGGLALRWITEKNLGLQAEINFTQQGWEEKFEEREDGSVHWTILKVDLYEVSVCTFPAYEETSVSARKADLKSIEKRKVDRFKSDLLKRLKGDK